jgi:hypothetical protein
MVVVWNFRRNLHSPAGGRDTAGLGGVGGPYRLDGGNPVHQVSDEAKAAVPLEVQKAAREMAQKAFKQRMKEIQMSEYDANIYEQYSGSVRRQVQALRVILDSLHVSFSLDHQIKLHRCEIHF